MALSVSYKRIATIGILHHVTIIHILKTKGGMSWQLINRKINKSWLQHRYHLLLLFKMFRIKLIREAEVQIRLRHPSIARLFGIVLEEGQCGLVLEYVKYGNIMQFMQDYTVDWGWKLQMSFDIVLGMNYLHTQSPSIADGELTNQNVLIGRGFKAKVR